MEQLFHYDKDMNFMRWLMEQRINHNYQKNFRKVLCRKEIKIK